jgi:predicted nuclease with RNAse H fold
MSTEFDMQRFAKRTLRLNGRMLRRLEKSVAERRVPVLPPRQPSARETERKIATLNHLTSVAVRVAVRKPKRAAVKTAQRRWFQNAREDRETDTW